MKKFHLFDVCLPDYFSGHSCPVFSFPVDNTTTGKDILAGLKDEFNCNFDFYEDITEVEFNTAIEALRKDFKENNSLNKRLFPDLPKTNEFDDSAHVFFIFGILKTQHGFNYIV